MLATLTNVDKYCHRPSRSDEPLYRDGGSVRFRMKNETVDRNDTESACTVMILVDLSRGDDEW